MGLSPYQEMRKQAQDKKLEPESLHATNSRLISLVLSSISHARHLPIISVPKPIYESPISASSSHHGHNSSLNLLTPVRNNLKEHVLWFVI
jgi:hypothetical protein